jgi:uncharacterized protein YndB with AHSA1/START domain
MDSTEDLPPIRQGSFIGVPPERVWENITTDSGWDSFFTQGTRVDCRVGGSIRFRWDGFAGDSSVVEDGGPVLEVEPQRKFTFQWSPSGHPTTVSFALTPRGHGTSVVVTESGYTTKDLSAYVSCATGWGEAVTLLKFYLEHGVTYGSVPPK